MTAQQVRLLRRFADEVVLLYDGDEAGQRAMFRAAPLFLEEGLAVTCPRLPAGMDPDDFLKGHGLAGFEQLLEQREDLGKVAIGDVLSGWDGTTAGKASLIERLQPLFDAARQPVVRAEYLRVVGERLELAESVVQSQLQQKRRPPSDRGMPQVLGAPLAVDGPHPQAIEENILRVVVQYPCLIQKLKDSGAVEHFREGRLRVVAEALTQLDPGQEQELSRLYDQLADSDLRGILARLVMQEDHYGGLEAACLLFEDRLGALRQRQVRQCRKDLLQSIRQAEQDGDSHKVKELLQQFQDSCLTPVSTQPNGAP